MGDGSGPGEGAALHVPPPAEGSRVCPQCGGQVVSGAATCMACGMEVRGTPASPPSAPASFAGHSSADVSQAPSRVPAGVTAAKITVILVAVVTVLLAVFVFAWSELDLAGGRTRTPLTEQTTPLTPKTEPPIASIASDPITEPTSGTAERTALMDAARLRLGVQDKFVVKCLYVQGATAAGIVNPDGSADVYLVAWARSGGRWSATWSGPPDAAGKAALGSAVPGLSAEIIARLGI